MFKSKPARGGNKMVQENEIITLVLGLGVLIFVLGNHSQLKRFHGMKVLVAGYLLALTAWILTILEGFWMKDFCNLLEHLCYAGSSLLMVVWLWKIFFDKREFS